MLPAFTRGRLDFDVEALEGEVVLLIGWTQPTGQRRFWPQRLHEVLKHEQLAIQADLVGLRQPRPRSEDVSIDPKYIKDCLAERLAFQLNAVENLAKQRV